jgi:uncharacterized protein (DUF1697 family)
VRPLAPCPDAAGAHNWPVHTFVALLRGVNLGARNKVSMPELRSSLAELGLEDVLTYIQSGNVVFRSASRDTSELAARIEGELVETFGVRSSVVIRTPAELEAIAADNPFLVRQADPRRQLHVLFLAGAPVADAVARLDPNRSPRDEFSLREREIYLHLPDGFGRSKLTIDYFERRLGVGATVRNWNTLLKLVELTRR